MGFDGLAHSEHLCLEVGNQLQILVRLYGRLAAQLVHLGVFLAQSLGSLFQTIDGIGGDAEFFHLGEVFPQTGYEHVCLVDFRLPTRSPENVSKSTKNI